MVSIDYVIPTWIEGRDVRERVELEDCFEISALPQGARLILTGIFSCQAGPFVAEDDDGHNYILNNQNQWVAA